MNILKKLEKKIEEAIKKLPLRPAALREPLEISRDILDELESKITALGGGRRVFPFNLLNIRLHAPNAERLALYEVAFVNNRALTNAVREHLRPPKCESPVNLQVSVEIIEAPSEDWAAAGYQILYDVQRTSEEATQQQGKDKALLIVIQGAARPMKYRIRKKRTNIGRQLEVLDKEGLPLRRNDLVFIEDGGEVNQTVSRRHAHINYDREKREFRLHDDDSAYGTLIVRKSGHRVKVTRALGAPLRSGDEIFFGQARLMFKTE